jgi:hypothetical protein
MRAWAAEDPSGLATLRENLSLVGLNDYASPSRTSSAVFASEDKTEVLEIAARMIPNFRYKDAESYRVVKGYEAACDRAGQREENWYGLPQSWYDEREDGSAGDRPAHAGLSRSVGCCGRGVAHTPSFLKET